MVAVMIGNARDARSTELPCNPQFADFLSTELVPWLRSLYNVTSDPKQVTIGGSSYGGLAATYAAYRSPGCFRQRAVAIRLVLVDTADGSIQAVQF